MVQRYRVRYTKRASDQLREIFDYIAKDSPNNAAKMIERILDTIEGVGYFSAHRYRVARNIEMIERGNSVGAGAALVS